MKQTEEEKENDVAEDQHKYRSTVLENKPMRRRGRRRKSEIARLQTMETSLTVVATEKLTNIRRGRKRKIETTQDSNNALVQNNSISTTSRMELRSKLRPRDALKIKIEEVKTKSPKRTILVKSKVPLQIEVKVKEKVIRRGRKRKNDTDNLQNQTPRQKRQKIDKNDKFNLNPEKIMSRPKYDYHSKTFPQFQPPTKRPFIKAEAQFSSVINIQAQDQLARPSSNSYVDNKHRLSIIQYSISSSILSRSNKIKEERV